MPLQTYDKYFGRPGQINVPTATNAFATGVGIKQRGQALEQGQQRTNEYIRQGQAQTAQQERVWEEAEKQKVRDVFKQAVGMVDPDEPDDETYVSQAEAGIGEGSKTLYGLYGERVGPALQKILPAVKAMRNPDGTINPEAVKHNRNLMRAYQQGLGIEPSYEQKERTKAQYRDDSPSSALGKLIADYNKLPEGSQFKQTYMQRIEKEVAQSGESISVDKEGNVSIVRGPNVGQGIPDKVMNRKVTEKMFNATESLRRLDAITKDIEGKPELLNFWHRAGSKIKSIGKRLGKDLSEEDTQQMEELRVFQRKAIENINSYIKEITGAQMSEKEADRIRLAQPDPGEGVWPAESYPEFMAALNDAKKQSRLSISRYQYLIKEGMGPESIKKLMEPIDPNKPEMGAPIDSYLPLDKFKQRIDDRGEALEKEGKTDEEIDAILIKEFVL